MSRIISHVVQPASTVVFDTKSRDPSKPVLKMSANCYRPPNRDSRISSPTGLTLILVHANAHHKEQWEPLLSHLFKIGANYIDEAWAFDWQSAGATAVLNSEGLKEYDCVSPYDFSDGIITYVKDNLSGIPLAGAGHSSGCHILMHTVGALNYKCLILIETVMLGHEAYLSHKEEYDQISDWLNKTLPTHQRNWPSKEEAYEWLSHIPPYCTWDSQALGLFCAHGLRPVDKNQPNGPVTFSFDKTQEALNLWYSPSLREGMNQVETFSSIIPLHAIFGEKVDFVAPWCQASAVDASKNRIFASITRIPDAGHTVLQQKPDAVAPIFLSHLKEACISSTNGKL